MEASVSTKDCIVYIGADPGFTVIFLISGMAIGYLVGCKVLCLVVSVLQPLPYGNFLPRARLREWQAHLAWDRTITFRQRRLRFYGSNHSDTAHYG